MAWSTLRTILIGVPLVFAAWGAVMLVLTLFQPAGQPVAVFAPGGVGPAIEAVVAADGYILQVRSDTVIAVAKDDGFVPRLYRSGAMLVVAASVGGCIVFPSGSEPLPPSVYVGEFSEPARSMPGNCGAPAVSPHRQPVAPAKTTPIFCVGCGPPAGAVGGN